MYNNIFVSVGSNRVIWGLFSLHACVRDGSGNVFWHEGICDTPFRIGCQKTLQRTARRRGVGEETAERGRDVARNVSTSAGRRCLHSRAGTPK